MASGDITGGAMAPGDMAPGNMAPGNLELRPVEPAELAAFARAEWAAFGEVPSDEDVALSAAVTRPEQSLAVFDGGRMVATALWCAYDLTLPGSPGAPQPVLAIPGVTSVGVHPTHRRRGLLTAMMARQVADLREQAHPLAILMASEALIYGRFGYGPVSTAAAVSIPTFRSAFRRPVTSAGRMRLADPDDAAKVLPGLHDRARRLRPGELSRPQDYWDWHLRDVERLRRGGAARFYGVHESERGEPDGYVSYRHRRAPDNGLADLVVEVDDLLALDDDTHAVLWRYVLDLDRVAEVSATRPVDDPLRWLLADPRQVRTTSLSDQLWLRVLDVPAALTARGYRVETTLVFDVRTDDAAAAGRWRLETGPATGQADCRRAGPGEATDVVLGLAELGAIYLGGVAPSALARAGLVSGERAGALDRADAAFAGALAPFSSTDF